MPADAARRLVQLSRLATLAQRRERVPIHLHDALAAAADLASRTRGRSPDALATHDVELAVLGSRTLALRGTEASLRQQAEAVGGDVHRLSSQAEGTSRGRYEAPDRGGHGHHRAPGT